jgi:hypothetical protein
MIALAAPHPHEAPVGARFEAERRAIRARDALRRLEPASPVRRPFSTNQSSRRTPIFSPAAFSTMSSGSMRSSCVVNSARPSLCMAPSGEIAKAVRPRPGNTPLSIQRSTLSRK